jgi:hypothetical protein
MRFSKRIKGNNNMMKSQQQSHTAQNVGTIKEIQKRQGV